MGTAIAPRLSDAAVWAVDAGNEFREVQRTTENATTKAVAEGLNALAEAVRNLDAEMAKVRLS